MGFHHGGIDAHPTALGDARRDRQRDHALMQPRNHLGAERAGHLQNGLLIRPNRAADARKGAIHQIGADLVLQLGVAPPIQVFEDQHAHHDFGGRAGPASPPALRPSTFQRLGHHLDEGLIIDQAIDATQRVGPQLVGIGQDDFPYAPLSLSTSNHAHSCDGRSCARSAVRRIRPRQLDFVHSAIRRDFGSWRINQLPTDFFTGK